MNLVVVLIPMLLQIVVFIRLGRIDYSPPPLPAFGEAGGGGGSGGGGGEILNLVVNVVDSAIQVSIFGATSGEGYWSIPNTDSGSYNYAALQNVLYEIKTKYVGKPIRTEKEVDPKTGEERVKEIYRLEDASIVRIAAGPNLDYQSLVSFLDATRSIFVEGKENWLFPQPVLGQLRMAYVAQ
jgi:hypothetical protein